MSDQTPDADPWPPSPWASDPQSHGQSERPQPYPPQPTSPPATYGYPAQGYPPPSQAAQPPAYAPKLGPYSPMVGRYLVPNETTWSLLAHLSIFALGIIGPIVIMLTEGKKSPFTRYHAVEALNMHLTVLIVELICIATFFLILPLLFLFGVAIAACVYGVIAAMAANRGEIYRYPYIWRLVT